MLGNSPKIQTISFVLLSLPPKDQECWVMAWQPHNEADLFPNILCVIFIGPRLEYNLCWNSLENPSVFFISFTIITRASFLYKKKLISFFFFVLVRSWDLFKKWMTLWNIKQSMMVVLEQIMIPNIRRAYLPSCSRPSFVHLKYSYRQWL